MVVADLTPPEALAAELEKLATAALKTADGYEGQGSQRNAGYWRGRHDAYTACAAEVRDQLAPAWAALADELASLREQLTTSPRPRPSRRSAGRAKPPEPVAGTPEFDAETARLRAKGAPGFQTAARDKFAREALEGGT
jgi:hypothetical protein